MKKRRSRKTLATSTQSPAPTDAELEILRVLWNCGTATVREIHNTLGESKQTGYTTTLKILQKMADKGLVSRDETQRSHVYSPAIEEEPTQKRLVGDLLARAFGGATGKLVVQALSDQSATQEELAEIRELLDTLEKKTGRGASKK